MVTHQLKSRSASLLAFLSPSSRFVSQAAALTVGLWFFVWFIIHIGLAAWALASTISFMSEQSAKKAIQEERDRQERESSFKDPSV